MTKSRTIYEYLMTPQFVCRKSSANFRYLRFVIIFKQKLNILMN